MSKSVHIGCAFKSETPGTMEFLGLRGVKVGDAEEFKGDIKILGIGDRLVGRLWKSKSENPKAPAYTGFLGNAAVAFWRPREGAKVLFNISVSPKEDDNRGGQGPQGSDFEDDDLPF